MKFSSIHSSIAVSTFLYLYKNYKFNKASVNDTHRIKNQITEIIKDFREEATSPLNADSGQVLRDKLTKIMNNNEDNYLIKYGIPQTLFRQVIMSEIHIDKTLRKIIFEDYRDNIYKTVTLPTDSTTDDFEIGSSIIELYFLKMIDPDPTLDSIIHFSVNDKQYVIRTKDLLFDFEKAVKPEEWKEEENFTKYTYDSRVFYGPVNAYNDVNDISKCRLVQPTNMEKYDKHHGESISKEKENTNRFMKKYSKLLLKEQEKFYKLKEDLATKLFEYIYALRFEKLLEINETIIQNLKRFRTIYENIETGDMIHIVPKIENKEMAYLSIHSNFDSESYSESYSSMVDELFYIENFNDDNPISLREIVEEIKNMKLVKNNKIFINPETKEGKMIELDKLFDIDEINEELDPDDEKELLETISQELIRLQEESGEEVETFNNPVDDIESPQENMDGSLEVPIKANEEENPIYDEPVPDIKPTADELLTDDPTDIMKKNILDDPFSSSYNSQIPIGTFFKVSEKIKIEEVKKAMDKGRSREPWCAEILKGTYDDDGTIRDVELIYKEYLGDPSQLHKMEIQVDEGKRIREDKCRQKDNGTYNNQIYVRFINTPEAQKNGKKHHASIYINPQSIILDSSKQTTEVIE